MEPLWKMVAYSLVIYSMIHKTFYRSPFVTAPMSKDRKVYKVAYPSQRLVHCSHGIASVIGMQGRDEQGRYLVPMASFVII